MSWDCFKGCTDVHMLGTKATLFHEIPNTTAPLYKNWKKLQLGFLCMKTSRNQHLTWTLNSLILLSLRSRTDAHSNHKEIWFIWLASLCVVILTHQQKGDGLNFWPLPSSRAPQTLESWVWTTVSTNAACNYFCVYFSSSNMQLLLSFPTQQDGLICYSNGDEGCREGREMCCPAHSRTALSAFVAHWKFQTGVSIPTILLHRDGFASVYREVLIPFWVLQASLLL